MAELQDLPGLMARCFAYLESQWVSLLELSAMDKSEASNIAKQLAFEMHISFEGYLVEAVQTWLQGAQEQRDLMVRANGVF